MGKIASLDARTPCRARRFGSRSRRLELLSMGCAFALACGTQETTGVTSSPIVSGNVTASAGRDAAALSEVPSVSALPEDEASRNDFSRVPPRVRQLAVRPGPDGRETVLLVEFEKDERLGREVVLRPDGNELIFRDDGEKGDEQAGDGIYSALTGLDFESVMEHRKALLVRLARAQATSIPVFEGRVLVDKRELLVDKALGGFAVPFGFPWLVDEARSLMITDLGVVEDPGRTFNPCTGVGTPNGKWTFGYLMRQMAGPIDPSVFVLNWLNRWLVNQTVNGFTVPARPNMSDIINSWPQLPDGKLDLDRSPMKLLAIVNRIDLAKNVGYGASGGAEGRFVFQWMDPRTCTASITQPFLIILEYGVPRSSCFALRDWAQRWRALGTLALGSPAYNAALDALTDEFTKAGAAPAKPNGSAINQIRTNEFKLASPWELREFHLLPIRIRLPFGGSFTLPPQLLPAAVINTPDGTYNGVGGGAREADLATWINANLSSIVVDAHSVPLSYPLGSGGPFRGGAAPNHFDFWNAAGILPFGAFTASDVRHHFSLNTCNGCHGRETSNAISSANFTHVRAVSGFGVATNLSGFLTGIDVTDPAGSGAVRHFDDLLKRRKALNSFANAFCGPFVRSDVLVALPRRGPDPTLPFPGIDHQPTLSVH
ncbi:MAG TPA: choice-of-anchor X domain-containing protein [Polyangia bacterium]|jgi:hypothetical protein|nr:choice-of-anchor X domain-containing protein [Polyangia bacterium]